MGRWSRIKAAIRRYADSRLTGGAANGRNAVGAARPDGPTARRAEPGAGRHGSGPSEGAGHDTGGHDTGTAGTGGPDRDGGGPGGPGGGAPYDPTTPVPSRAGRFADEDAMVPRGLRVAAAYSWRLLFIAIAGLGVLWIVGKLKLVFIPVAIAMLLSALLYPAVRWLRDRANFHRSLSAGLVLVGGVLAVLGTLTLVITQFVSGFSDVKDNALKGVHQIQSWLRTGPLHLSDQQLNSALDAATKWIGQHRDTLTTGAVTTASTVAELAAGIFLVLFITFFFLRDGRRIWNFVVLILPGDTSDRVGDAGVSAWQTLVAYVRATVLVAFIDAVGIGLALTILRVDFAFSLAALVFLGAFIPIVGATLSGAVAVLVALVTRGPVIALVLLGAVILIQQVEGHLLQPLIMGRAVAIHPLAVIIAIATGAVLAGIVGALVAVPTVAVLNTGVRHLRAHRAGREPPPPPRDVVVRD